MAVVNFKEQIMFIEKLWKEKPDLVLKAIKKIGDIDEEMAKDLSCQGINEKGYLQFAAGNINGWCIIYINDFYIQGRKSVDWGGVANTRMISNSIDWMKFMYKLFGEEYIDKFIDYRNNELDKFMREHEKKHTNATINVLAELGIKKYQDMQNQTK